MRVAAVQIELTDNKEKNLENALKYIEKCKGSDLIVLPEMLMGARTAETELYHMAEDVENGNFAKAISQAAVAVGADVCVCLWEDTGTDKVYNTAVVFGADGNIKTKYRKLHLFDALSVKESDFMVKGADTPEVFECAGVKCSLSICYDLRFPELYREMVRQGAELFITPAAWYAGDMKVAHLQNMLCARALENTCYGVCANLTGETFCGNTLAFSPFGEPLGQMDKSEGILFIDIDIEYLKSVREKIPCVANIRDDIYFR